MFIIPLRFMFAYPDGDGGNAPSEESNEEDDDPYDKERAMKLIDKLRNQIKDLKTTAGEASTLKKRVEELESAGKSELEKAIGRAEKAENDLKESSSSTSSRINAAKTRLAKMAIKAEAVKQGADEDLVVALIDISSLSFTDPTDDDPIGEPIDVDKRVKALIEKKPILKVNQPAKNAPAPTVKPGVNDSPPKELIKQIDRQYNSTY